MDELLLVAVIAGLAVLTVAGVYYYYVSFEAPKKPAGAPPKPAMAAPQEKMPAEPAPPRKKPVFEIPPEIPRNLATIKTIVVEQPEIIVNIARKWLREGKSDDKGRTRK